jgi:hypothetical protein
MTMLLTAFTMIAFAGVYALLMTMLGQRAEALVTALTGRPQTTRPKTTRPAVQPPAAARRLTFA